MSTTYPSCLSDAEWNCLQRDLPLLPRRGRPRTHPLRRILYVLYVLRTGCAWRYLPATFPPWQTVFYHYQRFHLKGTWHLASGICSIARCIARSGSGWVGTQIPPPPCWTHGV
jgi:putative transposase